VRLDAAHPPFSSAGLDYLRPDGSVTGHIDHSMASVFATLAFHWRDAPIDIPTSLLRNYRHRTQKLYYGTVDFNLPDATGHAAACNRDHRHRNYLETKIAAFKPCHASALWPLIEAHVRQRGARKCSSGRQITPID